jgi:hypothetical protein
LQTQNVVNSFIHRSEFFGVMEQQQKVVCTDIVLRPCFTELEKALALVAQGMPQGTTIFQFDDEVSLSIENFSFLDHGVGGVVWPAASVLSRWISSNEVDGLNEKAADGKSIEVLELGCGSSALGGLSCALCGCSATVTDFPDILKLTKVNILRNRTKFIQKGGRVTLVPLEWGSPLPSSLQKSFRLVIGADIIYNRDYHLSLLQTLRDVCGNSSDETRILLSFQPRHPEEERIFIEEIAPSMGFTVDELDITSCLVNSQTYQNTKIIELRFMRSPQDN